MQKGVVSPETILIIDDQEDTHDSLRAAIRSRGLTAVSAASTEVGIRLLDSDPEICAIVLDVNMPPDDQEVWRQLRKHAAWREIPLIVVTGAGAPAEDLGRRLGVPPYHCFTKPLDPDRILDIICQQCGLRTECMQSADLRTSNSRL